MKIHRYICLAVMMVCIFVLYGCSPMNSEEKVIEEAATVNNGYKVYRVKKDWLSLDSEVYQFHSQTSVDLVGECMEALNESDDKHYAKLFPDDVIVLDYDYDEEGKQANINFNEAYLKQESHHEVLARAAVVETMTQFGGVIDYVQFFVNGEPLKDTEGRNMLMMASDFVSSTSADLKDLQEATLTVYFSSTDGLHLVAEDIHVRYYNTSLVERVVMDCLMSGPLVDGHQRTLSVNTKLNSVHVTDGVCTVDFNQRFFEAVENQSFKMKVYSVVNSLCALEGVDRVQIMIDGQISDYSESEVEISQPLKANEEIILKTIENVPVLETVDMEESETDNQKTEQDK